MTITPVLTQARKRSMNSTRFGMKKQRRSPRARPREAMRRATRSLRASRSPNVSVATEPSARSYSSAAADARPLRDRSKMSVSCMGARILSIQTIDNLGGWRQKSYVNKQPKEDARHELPKPTRLHPASWTLPRIAVLSESGSGLRPDVPFLRAFSQTRRPNYRSDGTGRPLRKTKHRGRQPSFRGLQGDGDQTHQRSPGQPGRTPG